MGMRLKPAGEGSGSKATGMKWPLIGSAAGHLALVATLLLLRASAGPAFPAVVRVLLVEGDRTGASAEEPPALRFSRQSEPAAAEPGPPVIPAVPPAGGSSSAVPMSMEPVSGAARNSGGSISAERVGREARAVSVPAEGAKSASVPASGNVGEGGAGGAGEGPEIRLLRERIESRIVYPEEAIRRGQEGEVLLRIRVAEGGIPGEIRIARSSGARTLDEAARKGVARAAPLPSLPGWFEVPVRFLLR